MNHEITIIPSDTNTATQVEENLTAIHNPLGAFLSHNNLPTENIFSPIEERRKVITVLGSVLELLSIEKRKQASYLSKFTISVSLGMFDGALAFLWDETIKSLRKMIIDFDLHYFYDIAKDLSRNYKGLNSEEDIQAISEHDLLEISRRIGLLNNVNHRRLETVNYFRNQTSSAHPNEHDLSGLELISFLENCIKYVINAEYDHSILGVKRLRENIINKEIEDEDVQAIIDELAKLQIERTHDFVNSLFGLYSDPRQTQQTRENIEKLAKGLWTLIDEDLKYKIGAKFGFYRVHVENERKALVQRFLDIVDGNHYKDEDSLASELIDKLQNLRASHYANNNFYNEYPHAENISASLRDRNIPLATKKDFVKIISICYIGNGKGYYEGVDERALPYYENFINRFQDEEIKLFIHSFKDYEFVSDLDKSKAIERAKQLTQQLSEQTENTFLKQALNTIYTSTRIDKVADTTEYKTVIANI